MELLELEMRFWKWAVSRVFCCEVIVSIPPSPHSSGPWPSWPHWTWRTVPCGIRFQHKLGNSPLWQIWIFVSFRSWLLGFDGRPWSNEHNSLFSIRSRERLEWTIASSFDSNPQLATNCGRPKFMVFYTSHLVWWTDQTWITIPCLFQYEWSPPRPNCGNDILDIPHLQREPIQWIHPPDAPKFVQLWHGQQPILQHCK